MPQLKLVVIGASAGGLEALLQIISRLPNSLSVPILIVVHTRTEGDSVLPQILGRVSRVPVCFATDRAAITPGHIYIAPPDFHLLVTPLGIRLNRGPRENGFRPAIDPLFRSAARVYRSGTMGIILSGALDDGSYGLKVLKDSGGVAVVQDPDEAPFPSMPANAIRVVDVDHVMPAAQIPAVITKLSELSPKKESSMARKIQPTTDGPRRGGTGREPEPQNVADETEVQDMQETFGPPSGLTCPDCGGALWEIHDGALARYRCHVGHQFSIEGLDGEQQDAVESALWSAVRVLEEHADLRHRMARRAEASGMQTVSEAFTKSARDSHRQAHTIRGLLFGRDEPSPMPFAEIESARAAKRSASVEEVGGNGRSTALRATPSSSLRASRVKRRAGRRGQ
jgi:two-component system, chemotaxis family, protein-glutamate methylesterase/glutaminase